MAKPVHRNPDHWLSKSLRTLIYDFEDSNRGEYESITKIDALTLHAFIFRDSRLLLLRRAHAEQNDEWVVPTHTIQFRHLSSKTMNNLVRNLVIDMLKGGIQKGWLQELQFGDFPFGYPFREVIKDAASGDMTLHLCVNMSVKPADDIDDEDDDDDDRPRCSLHGSRDQKITMDPDKPGEYVRCRWRDNENELVKYLEKRISAECVRGCYRRNRDGTRRAILQLWETAEGVRSVLRDMLAGCLSIREVKTGRMKFVLGCTFPGMGLSLVSVPEEWLDPKRESIVVDGYEKQILWRGRWSEGVDFMDDLELAADTEGWESPADFLYSGPGARLLVEWFDR